MAQLGQDLVLDPAGSVVERGVVRHRQGVAGACRAFIAASFRLDKEKGQ